MRLISNYKEKQKVIFTPQGSRSDFKINCKYEVTISVIDADDTLLPFLIIDTKGNATWARLEEIKPEKAMPLLI